MAGGIGLRIMLAFDWISPDAETSEGKTGQLAERW